MGTCKGGLMVLRSGDATHFLEVLHVKHGLLTFTLDLFGVLTAAIIELRSEP